MSIQVMARKMQNNSIPVGNLTNNRAPTNSSSRIRQLQACCATIYNDPSSTSSSTHMEEIKRIDCSDETSNSQQLNPEQCKCPPRPQTSKGKLRVASTQGELIESRKTLRCGTN